MVYHGRTEKKHRKELQFELNATVIEQFFTRQL